MRSSIIALLGASVLCLAAVEVRADLGWSEEQYTQVYGPGQRGFGKANERGYQIGENHLTVEFSPDNTHSVGELWSLTVVRDTIPDKVKKASDLAERGPQVERVTFEAKGAIPADIHEAVVDDIVVRVDVRNRLVNRVAFCGPKPSCSFWRRMLGMSCETTIPCPVLERALAVDHTMDDLHKRAEQAVEQMQPR